MFCVYLDKSGLLLPHQKKVESICYIDTSIGKAFSGWRGENNTTIKHHPPITCYLVLRAYICILISTNLDKDYFDETTDELSLDK